MCVATNPHASRAAALLAAHPYAVRFSGDVQSDQVYLVFFLFASGFCALVYQMAWLRLLRLVFGASTAASAAVLAIFMGGLGLGSLVLGKWAEKSRNPLRLYAFLEILKS